MAKRAEAGPMEAASAVVETIRVTISPPFLPLEVSVKKQVVAFLVIVQLAGLRILCAYPRRGLCRLSPTYIYIYTPCPARSRKATILRIFVITLLTTFHFYREPIHIVTRRRRANIVKSNSIYTPFISLYTPLERWGENMGV